MKKLFVVLFFFIYSFQVQADNLSDSNQLFKWAEENYPQYFSPAGQETFQIENYLARYYKKTDIYLGTSGEDVYVYGDDFGGLLKVGKISDFIKTDKVYHFSEYFPVKAGNKWIYTTGERYFTDESYTNAQGQKGLLYATDTYEFEPFMLIGEGGAMLAEYEGKQNGSGELVEFPMALEFIPEEMKVGESYSAQFFTTKFTTTLEGEETIAVPAGEFKTIRYKIKITDNDDGFIYSYNTYMWLAKGVGFIKIDRENLLPPKDGCLLVCRPDNDFSIVNKPAELVSAVVNGTEY